jgi:hypothetical protein
MRRGLRVLPCSVLGFLAETISGPYVERIRVKRSRQQQRGVQEWRTLPLLVVAFVIVGYSEVLVPQDLVRTRIGPGSGWQGLCWQREWECCLLVALTSFFLSLRFSIRPALG